MSHTSFLAHTAQTLYQQYKENIGACCLVFPGRRAALFFQKELSVIPEREIWMPTVLGITQLIEKQTGQGLPIHMCCSWNYLRYIKSLQVNRKPRFVFLGNTLLHDFDQADKYLLNRKFYFTTCRISTNRERLQLFIHRAKNSTGFFLVCIFNSTIL